MKRYMKTALTEMEPWTSAHDMSTISVSPEDAGNGHPKDGGMVARDPNNPTDRWYINEEFFLKNYKETDTDPAALFPFNTEDAEIELKKLRSRWFPDRIGRSDVMAHINALYAAADEHRKEGLWDDGSTVFADPRGCWATV